MHSGTHLAIQNPPVEAVFKNIPVLGEILPLKKLVQFNEDGCLELYGCQNPVDLSCQSRNFRFLTSISHVSRSEHKPSH